MNNIELYKDVIDVVANNNGICSIAIEVAKNNPKAFLDAAAKLGIGSKTSIMDAVKKRATLLLRTEGKIPAIKYVRQELGWDLKEAKDFCDEL